MIGGSSYVFSLSRSHVESDVEESESKISLRRTSCCIDDVLPKNCDPKGIKVLNDIDALFELARKVVAEKVTANRRRQARMITTKLIEKKAFMQMDRGECLRMIKTYDTELRKIEKRCKVLTKRLLSYSAVLDCEAEVPEELSTAKSEAEILKLPDGLRESELNQLRLNEVEKDLSEILLDVVSEKSLIVLERFEEKQFLHADCMGWYKRAVHQDFELALSYAQIIVCIIQLGQKFDGSVSPCIIEACKSEYEQICNLYKFKYEEFSLPGISNEA